MRELSILELLIALFLLLPLSRPLIKALWNVDGLIWTPLLALGIIIAVFPAYGFRPECVPLLVYTIILNIANIPSIISFLSRLRSDDFRERGVFFTLLGIAALIIVTGIALRFSPRSGPDLAAEGVRVALIRDEARGAELFLRVYGPGDTGGPRPLMLLIPPVLASVTAVDRVCVELEARGFTVITYSRRHFDSPAVGENGRKTGVSIAANIRFLRSLTLGTRSESANALGRLMEEERMGDIRFLLSYIKQNAGAPDSALSGVDLERIFMTGYGAGGSALTLLSGSREFVEDNPSLRGIISVEGLLLSAFRGEPEKLNPIPEDANWFYSLWTGLGGWLSDLRIKKITGAGSVPRPGLPILFIVSDRVRDPRYRDERYAAILKTVHGSEAAAILAAVPGAGPLDYSDTPEKSPLYGVLFSGIGEDIWENDTFIRGTAALIANFAAMTLADDPFARAVPPERTRLDKRIYLETGGTWNLPESGYILGP
ncbi:MAG: hypothetical protein LBP32_05445 [Spirochaetaceae bacterium]|jgi:hypothetical protein|nr:hypothetical protein [Spirochaetaceae bacterium]